MDEFPARHEVDTDLKPGRKRVGAIALIAASVATVIGVVYLSRLPQPAVSSPTAAPPLSSDTEVAVAPAATEPPAPSADATAATPAGVPGGERAAAAPTQPAPAEVAPETAVDGRGQLTVRSIPAGALVTIDGVRAGLTPLTVRDLEYGPHEVQIARPGFVPAVERVVLAAEAQAPTLAVTLGTGSPGATTGAADGVLDVDSRPRGAAVVVNGRRAGLTPLRLPGLAPGVYAVRLELAGYRPVRADVPVEPGQPARLAVTLETVRR